MPPKKPAQSIPGLHLLPGKKPAEKRPRQDTPSPAKEVSGNTINWQVKIQEDTKWAKGKIGTAALGFKTDKIASLSQSVVEFLTVTLVEILERNATTASDMYGELSESRQENVALKKKLDKVEEELEQAKMCRRKVEAKASKKDTEDKIKTAATQFKVMNLDLGGAYTDRKELHEAARKALEAKVRTDLRAEYDSKIKQAAMKVLAAKPIKRQTETGEIWTAPVLVTIEDRDSRWQVEDMLRKSKVFPSFHWPREMVDNVKAYRQVINKLGFTDDEFFVRIRPDQRDGVWRIKADAKSKTDDGYGKFFPVAAFDLPPLDAELRSVCDSWLKPIWLSRFVTGSTTETADSMDSSITEEDIIMNL
jgi:hypothetical protein